MKSGNVKLIENVSLAAAEKKTPTSDSVDVSRAQYVTLTAVWQGKSSAFSGTIAVGLGLYDGEKWDTETYQEVVFESSGGDGEKVRTERVPVGAAQAVKVLWVKNECYDEGVDVLYVRGVAEVPYVGR